MVSSYLYYKCGCCRWNQNVPSAILGVVTGSPTPNTEALEKTLYLRHDKVYDTHVTCSESGSRPPPNKSM